MLSDITFGQFYPAKSFVHKTDPRTKIVLLIAYVVMIFLATEFWGLGVATLFLILAVAFAGVPIRSVLRSVRPVLLLVAFTAILNILFYQPSAGDHVYFWVVSREGLLSAAFLALRLVLLVMGSSLLTLTTTPVSLTDGLESLLSPLKLVKFPVHVVALIMSIALRFIPSIAEETERIIHAQKARGANFDTGNLFSRIKAMIPIIVPLIVGAFRRADELGNAMDSRCYGGSTKRTKYKKLTFTFRDLVATLVTALFFTAVILVERFHGVWFGL